MGASGDLRAALGFQDDNPSYSIFSRYIRELCVSRFLSMSANQIPHEILESVYAEAKEEFPVLLADVENPNSRVRDALRAYILAKHKVHRAHVSGLKSNMVPPKPELSREPPKALDTSPTKRKAIEINPPDQPSRPLKRLKRRELPDEGPSCSQPEAAAVDLPRETKIAPTRDRPMAPLDSPPKVSQDKVIKKFVPRNVEINQQSLSQPGIPPSSPDMVQVVMRDNPPAIDQTRGKPEPQFERLKSLHLSDLEDFLQAANPPLDKLLPHLIGVGIYTNEELRDIASWEDKDIMDFLTNARQHEMKSLTTLEIFRLKKHLKDYYAGQSS